MNPDTPNPRKRRRVQAVALPRVRRYHLEGKYKDSYRKLYNAHVDTVIEPFEPTDADVDEYTETLFGASTWSPHEQATLFLAMERLGRDNVPAIAQVIGTKSIPETSDLLLQLSTAAAHTDDTHLTLRDIPAAIDINPECSNQLDLMAEALAWYQEKYEMKQEKKRYGEHWLVNADLANDIECAIGDGRRRATSTPSTPNTRQACFRCRRHKIRCDREMPCSNCARSKKPVDCEYLNTGDDKAPESSKPQPQTSLPDPSTQPENASQVLDQFPEANLLRAENMVALSTNLFMNRSPDVPSPWPHWSEYANTLVPEPAMFRTAFRDFHSLTLNITKRLVQLAIMQATSRIRSKRRRLRHGVKPMVRKRDVRAAIDIMGLQRNGKHRWKGAARRCGVRVYDEQRLTRFKSKKWDLTYDEVEEILGPPKAPARTDTDASEPSGDEGRRKFKNRAARSGTPLPVGPLAISESGSDSDPVPDPDVDSNSDWESDIVLETDLEDDQFDSDGASDGGFPSSYIKRDPAGRFASIPPSSAIEPDTTHTLEQFDQEASRLEERALCRKLGLARPPKDELKSEDEPGINADYATIDHIDDWRAWTSYHAEWETFRRPVRAAKFAANQRPVAPAVPRPIDPESVSSGTDSGSDMGASARRSKRRKTAGIELEAQNPHEYAALQGSIYKMDGMSSDGIDAEEDLRLGADVPAQSVEDAADAMDWK